MSTAVTTAGVAYATLPVDLYHDPRIPDANRDAAIVLFGWLDHRANRDGETWCAVSTLAADVHWSEGKVRRTLAVLVRAGWITRRRRPNTSAVTRIVPSGDPTGPRTGDTPDRAPTRVPDRAPTRAYLEPLEQEPKNKHRDEEPTMNPFPESEYEHAVSVWPSKGVRYDRDDRKDFNRAKIRCGNAGDFAAAVRRWVEAYGEGKLDGRFCPGLGKWARNDLWKQEPPVDRSQPAAAPARVPLYDVDLDGNDLWDPENPGAIR